MISGDPHFRTFDGKHFFFEGHCEYTVMMPKTPSFNQDLSSVPYPVVVSVKNRYCDSLTDIICSKRINVILGSDMLQTTIRMESMDAVFIDNSRVSLPVERNRGALYTLNMASTSLLQLKTNTGFKLLWDGASRVEIVVSKMYKNQVMGMCGNYNGNGNDDSLTADGEDIKDEAKFAERWKVNSDCDSKTNFEYRGACARSPSYAKYALKTCVD